MSVMKHLYLSQLRPMDGQQADPPETESRETETETPKLPHRSHPNQESLLEAIHDAAYHQAMDDAMDAVSWGGAK